MIGVGIGEMFHGAYRSIYGYREWICNFESYSNYVYPLSEKLKSLFYLTAFLAYGVCDSLSAAYMMMVRGIDVELNPIIRYIVAEDGISGFIIFKIWAAIVIIGIVFFIQLRTKGRMNWTGNGFLFSLTVYGILATFANMAVVSGTSSFFSSPSIILLYAVSVILLMHLGDILDSRYPKHLTNKSGHANEQLP